MARAEVARLALREGLAVGRWAATVGGMVKDLPEEVPVELAKQVELAVHQVEMVA